MSVSESDIEWRWSGGTNNTSAQNSLGGAMSTQPSAKMTYGVMNNLFENVPGPDATSGKNYFKCAYVKNTHATKALTNVKMWISFLTPSASDEVWIQLDAAPVGTNSTTTTGLNTDPGLSTGPWRRPTSETDPNVLVFDGPLGVGQQKAFWVRREVQAGAAAFDSDYFDLSLSGEST